MGKTFASFSQFLMLYFVAFENLSFY